MPIAVCDPVPAADPAAMGVAATASN